MSSFNALRAIATRLTSTPAYELPHQVGYLATSLASCGDTLRNTSPNNDQSLLLHKLKTRVSTLLQDRTPEGRFSGIVIAKALVETGGTTFLADSASWVRSLISCLGKPDTPEAKRLCVVTISRIYLLTVGDQALVREITTPTLPAFISASLGVIKPSTTQADGNPVRVLSPLLGVVLRSWHLLLEHFASTVRPNAGSIKSICLSLISDVTCPDEVYSAAQDVLARLHFCAPKNTIPTDWAQTCSQAIEAAHDTADLVFRAIVEDWSPAIARTSKVTKKQKASSTPATSSPDVLGLAAWSGESDGCSTLARQVDVLRHVLSSQHAQEVNSPLGAVLDLTARLTAVTPPTPKFSLRINNEVTRDEREELWLNLPRIHIAVLHLFQALVEAFQSALFPVCHTISTQLWEMFEAEADNAAIRRASYELVDSLLPHRLLPLTKSDSANFRRLVQQCCNDLLVSRGHTDGLSSLQNNSATKKQGSAMPSSTRDLYDSAYRLLPAILTYAPLHKLAGYSSVRTQIDQTAILLNHHEAILASVLHPSRPRSDPKSGRTAPPGPSLMPFLARSAESVEDETHKLAFDALLRPRMPVVRSSTEGEFAEQDEHEAADEDEGEETYEDGHGDAMQLELNGYMNGSTAEATQEPHMEEATSSKEALQDFASTQKRDFTTLLEQSTDAQLAASASNDLPASMATGPAGTNYESVPKRPRLDDDSAQEEALIVIAEDQGQHFPSDRPPATAAPDTIEPYSTPAENTSTTVPLQAPVTVDAVKGKANAGYDSDDSSDSEVPPIDATLVGMSDSEDEDGE
ncbi:hypothetical protein OHC33_004192 [Knufia fluminis]|uniref:Pre-rRNA-processing protein RIX1 n=1 Tax=Knufia fluminis TaxID=191047 RepID=A0AAN8I9K5_9EURO|nr:hypothetical protein OHC33_004192 [Knufia fluminis]